MQKAQSPTLKEIRSHGTKSFPCAIYQTRPQRKGTMVKHHWHEEAEILYFYGGKFQLNINMEHFSIDSQCLFFINPGELHSIVAEKAGNCGEDAIVFHPGILSFDCYDTMQMHLIQPILGGNMRFPRCILPSHPAFSSILHAFSHIMHSFGQRLHEESPQEVCTVTDDLTKQLYIKSDLLRIFAVLSENRLFTPMEKNYDKRVEGIKSVLTYIKENYREKIYIRDMAGLLNMNEQYFCRFFKKAIGRSPMDYVNEYRIKHSVRLLEETDLTVTEICLECGFNNYGNFIREFRKSKDTTPLQYRRQYLANLDADIVKKS